MAQVGGHRRDYRAIEVAKTLRDLIDAECVILFGSRCRDDWRDRSDVDLMVINPGRQPRMTYIASRKRLAR